MASATPRWGYTSSILAVLVGLTVWLLQQAGWLESWNAAFYDRIFHWTSHWRQQAPEVLTVQVAREDALSGAEAIQLLDTLHELGAKATLFNFLPARNSRQFYQRAADLHNVVFGRELRPDPDNPDTLTLEPWPAVARELELAWGVVYLHPGLKGIYRWHQADVVVGDKPFPTLEMRATEPPDRMPPSLRTKPFLVSFLGGPGSFPNFSVSRVLAGELIPELVKGKWILVGTSARLPGLCTPLCRSGQTMSLVEFEASALQTLLDGAAMWPLSGWWTLLLLIGAGLISSMLNPRVTSTAGVRVAVGSILVCAIATASALVLFKIWIPLGSLALAQAGQFAFTLVLKTRVTNRALTDMRLHGLNQIRERLSAQEASFAPDYWSQLGEMIQQTLNVERMVLLERIPGTSLLREGDTFGCVFAAVQEKARTLLAPVYSEAVAKGRPVGTQGFFAPGRVLEQEFVCPLVHEGELLGVWCVAIAPTGEAFSRELEPALSQFSRQIARMCCHRQRASVRRTLVARLKTWFSVDKQDQAYRELKSTANSLEQYYDMLDSAISQLGAATIIYDFFGSVLKANDLSVTLLRPENFSPARATALEFLRLATGGDELQVRRLLRAVLVERVPASLPIRLPAQGDRQFLLRVNPLSEQKPANPAPGPLNVRGMVCEIIETTSLSTLATLKGLVADRLGLELRDHLAAIELSADLLELESFPASERQTALEAIRQKTDACLHVIDECQKYLGKDVDAHSMHCFPVDGLELLGQVCADIAPKAAERRVTLKVTQPRFMAQVLASSADLTRLFSSIIELLLHDSAEDTSLMIEVENVSHLSTFRFVNSGFGIPNERLQSLLASPESPPSELFQILRLGTVWVRNWGGSLEISSEVGQGYTATLRLRQFQLTPSSELLTQCESGPPSMAGQRESGPRSPQA